MSSFVTVTLDTTPPVWTGVLVEDDNTMLATLSLDADDTAFEVKVWGNIDPTWPGNADYAEHEEDAPWIPFDAILQLRLSGGKRIRVRVRDDLWNESDDQLFGIGTLPPPVVTQPVPLGDVVHPEHVIERREVVTRSTIRFSSHDRVRVQTRRIPRGEPVITRSRVLLRSRGHVATLKRDSSSILVRTRERRGALHTSESGARVSVSATISRRPEGPDTEAALLELDLL